MVSTQETNVTTSTNLTSLAPTDVTTSSASGMTGGRVVHFSITDGDHNTTSGAPTATSPAGGGGGEGSEGLPGGVAALLLGLLVLGVALFCLLLYLKRSGKLYRLLPLHPGRKRRASTSSSHRPLDLEDASIGDPDHDPVRADDHDDLPPTREGRMFTIDDFEPEQNDEYSRSAGTADEYFYDEAFGKSVFEDEATNASMRHLYLASENEDDDMFDVDAIVNSISRGRPITTSTTTTAAGAARNNSKKT